MDEDEALISAEELAHYLNVPLGTVYGWNHRGTGPRRYVVGRHVRYRVRDVRAWLEERPGRDG